MKNVARIWNLMPWFFFCSSKNETREQQKKTHQIQIDTGFIHMINLSGSENKNKNRSEKRKKKHCNTPNQPAIL